MSTYLYHTCLREKCILMRQKRILVNSFLLFFMILVFFPLTIPADLQVLREVFPGLVWIALLFSFFLSAEHLFYQDEENGVLEQWLICPYPLHALLRTKLLMHWLFYLIPILLSFPILMFLFDIHMSEMGLMMCCLMCGTPTIMMFCALAAAFSTGLQQKGVFMALIILPLSLPVMIIGSGILTHVMYGLPVIGDLALLLAMSLFTVLFLPWIIGGALRVNI